MKEFDETALNSPRSDTSSDSESIKLEIRWLYREAGLPGKTLVTRCDLECEEIYESDHYDEVSSTSLLAPIQLHDRAQPVLQAKSQFGMPIVEFYCKRFWSVYRKSLVPSSGLDGRVARGRAYSRTIGKNASLKASLDRVSPLSVSASQLPFEASRKIVGAMEQGLQTSHPQAFSYRCFQRGLRQRFGTHWSREGAKPDHVVPASFNRWKVGEE